MKILHPKDRERVLAGHNRARRTGTPFREEYRLVARDGSEVWVRGEAAPIVTGDGKPRQRAGMILDITDRKRHEGNLKRRGGRFRELLENAMEGIAQIAPEGGIIEQCNSAYARILCLTPKEAVGRSFFEFVEGEDEREARHQRELRISGTGSKYEVSITAADGKRKVLSCGGYPLLGADGSYEGAVQTVFDVTELRERERALRASEEMSGGLSRQRGSE